MKEIKREQYLNELISARENKLIKVITGIRRCGKSYLLDPIFKNYLIFGNRMNLLISNSVNIMLLT